MLEAFLPLAAPPEDTNRKEWMTDIPFLMADPKGYDLLQKLDDLVLEIDGCYEALKKAARGPLKVLPPIDAPPVDDGDGYPDYPEPPQDEPPDPAA